MERRDGTADIPSTADVQAVESDVEPVEEGGNELVVTLQTAAFVLLGVMGVALAFTSGQSLIGVGFLVFSILPAVLSWLVN